MASYEKQFVKPYEEGWQNLPSEDTPIRADILNDYDSTLERIENYLSDNDIPPDQTEDVTELKESFTQQKDAGFLQKNLFVGFKNYGVSSGKFYEASNSKTFYANVTTGKTYTISTNIVTSAKVFGTITEIPKPNGDMSNRVALTNNIYTFTATTAMIAVSFNAITSDGFCQIEEGTEATSYTEYAPSNSELRKSLTPQNVLSSVSAGAKTALNSAYCSIVQVGKMIHANLAFSVNENMTSGDLIAILPKPKHTSMIFSGVGNTTYARLLLNTNGNLQVFTSTIASGNTVFFNVSYEIA